MCAQCYFWGCDKLLPSFTPDVFEVGFRAKDNWYQDLLHMVVWIAQTLFSDF